MSTSTKPQSKQGSILTRNSSDERGLRTRQRRSGLLALAALLIVGSALAGGLLFSRAGNTVEVLAVRDAVPKGHEIERSNLITRSVAGVPNTIASANADTIVGDVAAVDLMPGQLLTTDIVTEALLPGTGESLVGLNLAPERVPSAGLAPGDVVDVIAVPAGNNAASQDELDAPATLASGALVYDVMGSATAGGAMLVTVVVAEGDASRIAAYSTAGRIAVIETSPGGGS